MTDEPANDDAMDERLVAYLDGELDPQASREIEDLLACDPEIRGRLQRLDRTWELLDRLDRPPSADRFTQTTLEMVAVEAEEELDRLQAEAPRRRRRRWLLVGCGLLIAGLTGYAVAAMLLPDPNRDLIRDLPVLENFDQYRRIDSVEFLRELHTEGVFAEQATPLSPMPDVVPTADESPAAARRRIARMSAEEKAELAQRQQQLERLEQKDPDEPQRLRKLHDAIEQQSDANELRETMRRYSEWLKTLPTYRRMELVEMNAGERIEEIKRLQAEHQQELTQHRDAEVVFRWMRDYAQEHADQLTRGMPESARRKIDGLDPTVHRRWLFWMAWHQLSRPGRTTLLDEAEMKDLCSKVSPETATQLERMSVDDQRRKIAGMIRDAFHHESAARNMRGPLPEEHEKRLAQFFEDKLTSKQREDLLNLPGDEMMRELRRMYLMQFAPPPSSGRNLTKPRPVVAP
ncbi:MAG: hypothetical protein HQ567_13200 [Candidatus Nealsonbacteria bacterium]|nr:hypothetical protein [Candidatus Nealsonbacteria bacterium]